MDNAKKLIDFYEALEGPMERLVERCNNAGDLMSNTEEVIAAEVALEKLHRARLSTPAAADAGTKCAEFDACDASPDGKHSESWYGNADCSHCKSGAQESTFATPQSDASAPGSVALTDERRALRIRLRDAASDPGVPEYVSRVLLDASDHLDEPTPRVAAALAASQPAPEQSFVPPMMEEGSREAAMVVLERDASGKPTVWCDPEIAPIVGALIKAGIRTSWSCSGHGHRPGVIGLVDGRHLMIFNTDEDHEKAEAVFTTDINGVNDALLESQAVPEDQIEPLLQKLCDAIKGGLDSYRCTYIVDADDGQRGMPLADLLTLPGDKTIKRGEDEIEMIADAMYHVIKPVLLAAAPTPSKGEA